MKYQVDQWVLYDPFADNPNINSPKKAVILYVFKKSEHSFYDYEIYIEGDPGRYLKVRENVLYPLED